MKKYVFIWLLICVTAGTAFSLTKDEMNAIADKILDAGSQLPDLDITVRRYTAVVDSFSKATKVKTVIDFLSNGKTLLNASQQYKSAKANGNLNDQKKARDALLKANLNWIEWSGNLGLSSIQSKLLGVATQGVANAINAMNQYYDDQEWQLASIEYGFDTLAYSKYRAVGLEILRASKKKPDDPVSQATVRKIEAAIEALEKFERDGGRFNSPINPRYKIGDRGPKGGTVYKVEINYNELGDFYHVRYQACLGLIGKAATWQQAVKMAENAPTSAKGALPWSTDMEDLTKNFINKGVYHGKDVTFWGRSSRDGSSYTYNTKTNRGSSASLAGLEGFDVYSSYSFYEFINN
jgi:hypothetical protein